MAQPTGQSCSSCKFWIPIPSTSAYSPAISGCTIDPSQSPIASLGECRIRAVEEGFQCEAKTLKFNSGYGWKVVDGSKWCGEWSK